MADTDWTADELASVDRIPRYNILDPADGGDAYSFGGDGYIDNQMRQAKDVQVIGKAARRFSLFALAQALLSKQESDDATSERIAAQNAASTAYKWANAPENEEVEPGKFSALHFMRKAFGFSTSAKADADRAQGYAQGLSIPQLNSSVGGYFLKANAGGTAYEFGQVLIATAAQINASDGKGFANAETLGPILQGMKDATASVADKVPEIGSYQMRMAFSPAPGSNWLEAKGQVVSLAAYPGLATVLPATLKQVGQGNPGYQPLIFLNGTNLMHAIFGGSKLFVVHTNYGRMIDIATGATVEGTTGLNADYWYTGGGIRPMVRTGTSEVIFRNSQSSALRHLNFASAATLASGEVGSNHVETSSATDRNQEGLYKLPNDTIIHFQSANGTQGSYINIWKLSVGSTPAQWAEFQPSGFTRATMPGPIRHWQAKDGYVYVALRPYGSTGNISIFRTLTGASWISVGSFSLTDAIYHSPFPNRDGNVRPVSMFEESANGQQMIVNVSWGYLISVDGGASWTFRDLDTLFSTVANGYVARGKEGNTYAAGFSWDKAAGQWIFCCQLRKNGNQQYLVIWTATNPLSLTKIADIVVTNDTSASASGQPMSIHATNGFYFVAYVTASVVATYRLPKTNLPAAVNNSTYGAVFGVPRFRLEGTPFDGLVFGLATVSQVAWVAQDDSDYTVGQENLVNSYGPIAFAVSADKTKVANLIYNNADGNQFLYYGSFYDYNPATERKLPNVSFPNVNGAGYGIKEEYRSKDSQPRVYMRVR